jgi:hypothetical protein
MSHLQNSGFVDFASDYIVSQQQIVKKHTQEYTSECYLHE